jgi:uncharacterized protein with von Willebrand factor type A (vWA) domain
VTRLLLEFVARLRAAGHVVPTSSAVDALAALQSVDLQVREEVYLALRATLVCRFDERAAFDRCFDAFFAGMQALGSRSPTDKTGPGAMTAVAGEAASGLPDGERSRRARPNRSPHRSHREACRAPLGPAAPAEALGTDARYSPQHARERPQGRHYRTVPARPATAHTSRA